MWGKRRKRGAQLPRQLALGLLQDAMGRVEEQNGHPEGIQYPEAGSPQEAPPDPADLQVTDVPVDNSGGPSDDDEPSSAQYRPGNLSPPRRARTPPQ
jgi:hypothetical protein